MASLTNWARDPTGRFPQRPYYTQQHMDFTCEQLVINHLKELHGRVDFPLDTEDLKILLEQQTSDLDLYSDFCNQEESVEGSTQFFLSKGPVVRISRLLTESESRQNRLRTTLSHELGHVVFHSCLTAFADQQRLIPASDSNGSISFICKRSDILQQSSRPVDWMEWQAGYASGAFLMPHSELKLLESDFRKSSQYFGPIYDNQTHALSLVAHVQNRFQVSKQAARVRLAKLEIIEK